MDEGRDEKDYGDGEIWIWEMERGVLQLGNIYMVSCT